MDFWPAFHQTLCRLGPRLLTGVDGQLRRYIRFSAIETDNFHSDQLDEIFEEYWSREPELAVKRALECWAENVRNHLNEILTFDDQIDGVTLEVTHDRIVAFLDSVTFECGSAFSWPQLLLQAVVHPYRTTEQGSLVYALAFQWRAMIEQLRKNPEAAHQIPPRKWEEIVAAAFDKAGFDEVTLTPRSGDHGRDVSAVKKGVGSIKIIDSVKAYRPNRPVRFDDIRSILGVLSGDLQAPKAILTTTSSFPPGILNDPFIRPFIPHRLELMDGNTLMKWLEDLAFGTKP